MSELELIIEINLGRINKRRQITTEYHKNAYKIVNLRINETNLQR